MSETDNEASEVDNTPSHLIQSRDKFQAFKKEIFIPSIEKEYEGWFNKFSELQEGDIVTRSNCKFCHHPLRAEGERRWEETHNFLMVVRLFDDYRKTHPEAPCMSCLNVRSHINSHYEQTIKKMQIKEYGSRLQDMLNYKISKDRMFEALTSSLQMKYIEVAADSDIDRIKQGELMVKISKALLEICETQAKLRGEIDSATVISDKFVNVWVGLISQEKNPDTQRKLIEQLEIFRSEMEMLNKNKE